MSLNLLCSHLPLDPLPCYSSPKFPFPYTLTTSPATLFYIFFHNSSKTTTFFSAFSPAYFSSKAASNDAPTSGKVPVSELLDEELINAVSAATDAAQALDIITERNNTNNGVVGCSDCCLILSAAIDRGNADLAVSIFYAMSSSFDSVSDALRIISSVCRVGASAGEEIVSCSKCPYQYELVSGTIPSIESEEIRSKIKKNGTENHAPTTERSMAVPTDKAENNFKKVGMCSQIG